MATSISRKPWDPLGEDEGARPGDHCPVFCYDSLPAPRFVRCRCDPGWALKGLGFRGFGGLGLGIYEFRGFGNNST